MNNKRLLLAERRVQLLAQVAAQRLILAQNIEPLRIPLARVDTGIAALRFIKRYPAWTVGGAVLLTALRPGRVWKLLRRGWAVWLVVSHLRNR